MWLIDPTEEPTFLVEVERRYQSGQILPACTAVGTVRPAAMSLDSKALAASATDPDTDFGLEHIGWLSPLVNLAWPVG